MPYKSVREYYDDIVKLVAQKGLASEVHKIEFMARTKDQGLVRGQLVFNDGATLTFSESIKLFPEMIVRSKYSFHYVYEKNDIRHFFRYDKDTDNADPPIHAECHLHVDDENGPRYITHETSFVEVFEFIMAEFYRRKGTNGRRPRSPER